MLRNTAAFAAAFALAGCASIVNDTIHPMKLETQTADGAFVSGAECRLTNDYGTISGRSGDTLQVRRSNKDLDISCKHADQPEAQGRAISRANAGLAGNIIFGGGIGAIIDHSKGTAYTYPTWVRMVFGKTLVFDRSAEKEGQPVVGTEPLGQPAPAAAKTAAPAAPVPSATTTAPVASAQAAASSPAQ